MKNVSLQILLKKYPANIPVRLRASDNNDIIEVSSDSVILTSETAYIDSEAPEGEWDHEDGKVELGDGQQYLLINPVIT